MKLLLIILITLPLLGCGAFDSLALKSLYPFDMVNEQSPSTKSLGEYPNENGPVIIYLHGNGMSVASVEASGIANKIAKLGYLYVPEYPGIGPLAADVYNQDTISAKVLADFNTIEALHEGRRIVIIGRSLGAAVAARLAVVTQKDLLLISPWTSAKGAAKDSKLSFFSRFVSDKFWKAHAWNTLKTLSDFTQKVMVIHGAKDSMIPPEHGMAIADMLDAPLVLTETGHNDIYVSGVTWATIEGFLK